jgi:hypothetical protein
VRILLMLESRVNAGSIQAVSNYVRAGDELGHIIALYGHPDPRFPTIRFATDYDSFDYVVVIMESWLGWLSGVRLPRLLAEVPRARRAILDADGMYNHVIVVDGYDRNHPDERVSQQWFTHHRFLSAKIMQPTAQPREPDVIGLPFYGYDPTSTILCKDALPKRYDIIQVGHNWWRWRDVSRALLPGIERVRHRLDRICFVGSWWLAQPAGAKELNVESAFGTDPEWMQRLGIEVRPAVPYTEVIPVMSEARINIMTQRPLFRELKLLTSKYFEIFSADTVPLVMLGADLAESVYGQAGRELAIDDEVDEKLVDVLDHPAKYREIVEEVRRHLTAHHSYQNRVQELVAALQA